MLNEIILSRIMTSIANQNINPNFASAIHPEMLLLTACLEMEDSCWEQRLRAGTFLNTRAKESVQWFKILQRHSNLYRVITL